MLDLLRFSNTYFAILPSTFSTAVLLSLSLVCFWKLREFRKAFCEKTEINRNNFTELSNKYIRLRNQFQNLDSKMSLVLLSNFGFSICYFLIYVYMATTSQHSEVQAFQSLFRMTLLVTCCLVHGLPHEMSNQISSDLDIYLLNSNKFVFAKMILEKNIAFHLLGTKYDKTLIGPVLAFILSYIVIIVQTGPG